MPVRGLVVILMLIVIGIGLGVVLIQSHLPAPMVAFQPTQMVGPKNVPMVYVPAGCFLMGSDPKVDANAAANEQPQHKVCLTQSFWLDKQLVTNTEFGAFVKDGGYTKQSLWSADGWNWIQSQHITSPADCTLFSNMPEEPAECVNYYEAEAYANWRGGRLPTEAEWEYAARGPQDYIYPWGNTFDSSKANTDEKGLNEASNTCSYPGGNSWIGACDMAGNAWEWVADWYGENYYLQSPASDPTGPPSGTERVIRGGSWHTTQDEVRTAVRLSSSPEQRLNDGGFRVAVDHLP